MAFDVGTAVGYLDLDTSGFTRGFSRARADMKTFSDENSTFNDKLAATGSILKNVGSSLTKWVTVPLVGAGAATIKTAANFESGMSKVAAISGATGTQLDQLTDKALEMGAQTKFSASEAASAMEYMAMAGWKTEDMLNGIEGIMSLAAASGEDLATTSDIVTDALTAFGLSAQDAGRFSDVLAAASSNSNTNVSLMGETFKYVAPLCGTLGYSVEDTAVAIGLMANAGIKGSQAGTSLKTALANLAAPTKEQASAMEQLGVSLTKSNGETKSLMEVMQDLKHSIGGVDISVTDSEGNLKSYDQIIAEVSKTTDGLSKVQQIQAASTIFGKEAMAGLLAIVNSSDEDFSKLTTGIYKSKDAADIMAKTMQDNLSGQLTILGSTIEGIAISFGNILLPMIKKVVEGLQGFASWINGLSDSQKEFIANALLMAAAIGPVILIIGKLVTGFLTLKKYFSGIMTAFSAGKGIIAALGGSFGPILLIIAAVVAAIIALKAAWDTNFGGIREKTAEIAASLQSMFNNMISMLQSWGNFFLGLWESDWLGIQSIFKTLWKRVEVLFSLGLDILNEVFQLFSNLFQGNWSAVWQNVLNIFTNIVQGIYLFFATALDALVNLLTNIGSALWDAATTAFEQIHQAFSAKWKAIKVWFDGAKKDPVKAIEGIASSMYDAGKTVISKLWDGLKSAWEAVAEWANGIASWLTDILSVSADVTVNTNKGGSFASGLDYVPRDMIVKVHEGESIRTKQQTREDAQGSSGGGDNFYFYSPEPIDEIEAAKQMKRAKRDLAEGF